MTTKWNRAAAAGGFLLGAGAAFLTLLALQRLARAGSKPSLTSKLLAKIPFRVKLAAVAGALKGGGGAALQAASRRLSRAARKRRPRPASAPRSARGAPSFDRF